MIQFAYMSMSAMGKLCFSRVGIEKIIVLTLVFSY